MKRALFLGIVGVALVLAFVAGAVTAISRQWGQPLVTVVVENRSGEALSSVEVSFRSSSSNGVLYLPQIPKEERVLARFYISGEGAYTVKATLQSGKVLTSGEGYVESGYQATELVRNSEIQSASGYISPPK